MYNFLGGPTVRHCTFRANRGTLGGAMMNDASDTLIESCDFEDNAGISGGGAIYNYNSQVTIRSSTFANNASIAGPGAAVHGFNSEINCDACDFRDNSSYAFGAVALHTNSRGLIEGCTFDANQGGALSMLTAAQPRIVHCTFSGNHASNGGAVYVSGADAVIEACNFTSNIGENGGGAVLMLSGNLAVADSSFVGNLAPLSAGGAALIQSTAQARFRRCRFAENVAERGGGVYIAFDAVVDFVRCDFLANVATQDHGGAIFSTSGTLIRLVGSRVIGNHHSVRDGGGVYAGSFGELLAVSTLFAGNQAEGYGGGTYNGAGTLARYGNCTFTQNSAAFDGNGMYSVSAPVVENSILWNNAGLGAGDQIAGDTPQINHSCLPGSWGGVGNISADPLFVDADGVDDMPGTLDDEVRLQNGSPAIDQGAIDLVAADAADTDDDGDTIEPTPIDVDGHARVLCAGVDMGASESGIGDADCNGTIDLADFSGWAACMTGPAAGPYAPDCHVFDFNLDGDVDAADYAGWQRARN
jgi:predicted outer membrane repeat protein